MGRFRVIMSVLVVLALDLACGCRSTPGSTGSLSTPVTSRSPDKDPVDSRPVAPAFSTTDLHSDPVTLVDLKSKGAVLLHFWSIDTPSTTQDMADIAVGFHRWGNKVAFVSINVGDSENAVRNFVKAGGYQWIFAVDLGRKIATAYEVTRLPSLELITKSGIIWFSFNGGIVHGSDMDNAINYTMAERSARPGLAWP